MATTLANINIKDSSSWNTYLNLIYPVGSVYISYTSTSPATRFGGTWSSITGRFPYFNAGIGTDGSNTVTLTTLQMPSHTHSLKGHTVGMGGNANSKKYVFLSGSGTSSERLYWWSDPNKGGYDDVFTIVDSYNYSNSSGGGKSHNNMPAYQTLYAWRRTA